MNHEIDLTGVAGEDSDRLARQARFDEELLMRYFEIGENLANKKTLQKPTHRYYLY